MSAPATPLAYDWLVLQAALEALQGSTQLADLVSACNALWNDAAAIAAPDAAWVEVAPKAQDVTRPPQGPSALRLTITSSRDVSRGLGYQARTEHRLQLRALVRVPDAVLSEDNAAAGGKGWTTTTGEMRARNLALVAAFTLEAALIGGTIINPDSTEEAPLDPLCIGVYDVTREGLGVDFPTGDGSLARATIELRVRQRTRSGIGGWTP